MNRTHARGVGDHMTRQQTQDALAGTPMAAYLEQEVAKLTPEVKKRRGIERATKRAGNEWVERALAHLQTLCETRERVWAGDLRRVCDPPASPFAWATPWTMARRRGWIDPMPVDQRPADWPDGQRHLNPVYRSLIYRERAA